MIELLRVEAKCATNEVKDAYLMASRLYSNLRNTGILNSYESASQPVPKNIPQSTSSSNYIPSASPHSASPSIFPSIFDPKSDPVSVSVPVPNTLPTSFADSVPSVPEHSSGTEHSSSKIEHIEYSSPRIDTSLEIEHSTNINTYLIKINNNINIPQIMCRDDIYKMFHGDILALEIAIKLLISVSQKVVVTLAQHKNNDTKFYSEALELVMGCCKPILKLNPNIINNNININDNSTHDNNAKSKIVSNVSSSSGNDKTNEKYDSKINSNINTNFNVNDNSPANKRVDIGTDLDSIKFNDLNFDFLSLDSKNKKIEEMGNFKLFETLENYENSELNENFKNRKISNDSNSLKNLTNSKNAKKLKIVVDEEDSENGSENDSENFELYKVVILEPCIYEITTEQEREDKLKRERGCRDHDILSNSEKNNQNNGNNGNNYGSNNNNHGNNNDSFHEKWGDNEGNDDYFYLTDYTNVFPILSGLALRLLYGNKQETNVVERCSILCSTLLALARKHGDALHIIRAVHLQFCFFSRLNHVKECAILSDEIAELYVYEKHSFQMNKLYGGDRGINAMASASVMYVLTLYIILF